jgi:hypothetical protein
MTLESKNCKACRPKHKPTSKLTKKDLHNKVQTGDLNAYLAQNLLIIKQRTAHNKQAIASRKRWLREWKAELTEALKPITKEIVSARNTWTYARDKGYVDKAEFYFEYMGLLKRAKEYAEYSHTLHPRRPASAEWDDYISPEVFTRVRDMWAALPPVFKTGKIPLLITYRPEADE